ncbi:GntR family transcriptional regulator [Nakamurella flavida]|uniref:GntR family transcriptional regulator n=1 Tax=Nakamurella flavida TaxID=363630 RepID=A0A938YCB4_9ACTN|nr:GntR family transcriptional regulator [Nakamurella flavida]MBM9475040.1 GntR family transcriptional regulator [Nakamurella flavida]MDP9776608.1 DNA-binding GntR family transcriptional regulator [Nakamurella flavida]
MDATASRSAADRVHAHVRDGILTRRYPDNTLLSEGGLALETSVSRTPVREALLRLEAEGMITLLPKRGALVQPVSAQEARDVLATRRLVEVHCALAVIAAGRGADLARSLQVPLAALRKAAADGDMTAYVTADRDFHATVVAADGNMILQRLYGSLRDRQLRMGTANLLDRSGRPDETRLASTCADHEAIAAAIGAGDADLTRRLTVEHLATAERRLLGAGAGGSAAGGAA